MLPNLISGLDVFWRVPRRGPLSLVMEDTYARASSRAAAPSVVYMVSLLRRGHERRPIDTPTQGRPGITSIPCGQGPGACF